MDGDKRSETTRLQGNEENEMHQVTRRTSSFALLVLFSGAMASAIFLNIGVRSARDQSAQFDRHASELVQDMKASWTDYETAGLWIHEACRNRDFSREDFRELYQYLTAGDLEFQAAEFIPRISREERAVAEQDSRSFYKTNYPNVTYIGFKGLEPDPENPEKTVLQPRSEQDFYYPVHYVEPVEANAAAIDFDLWSSSSRRASIQSALDSWKPALTARLRLVQETDESAYSVLLMHPGIPLLGSPETQAQDISLMVIRIPSLLERTAAKVDDPLQTYIYDNTVYPPEFLGALELNLKGGEKRLTFLPEVQLEEIGTRRFKRVEQIQVASREWTIVVQPVDETSYSRSLGLMIAVGVVIVVGACVLSSFMYFNMVKTIEINQQIRRRGAAERLIVSSLFPTQVRDRILNESEGNQSLTSATSEIGHVYGSKPIADLFPEATIMFADMVGFTSWSSVREPAQVFILLETTFHSFDLIAKEMGHIFKVETVGDCYVAVSGLPEPHEYHAVSMARFAVRCLEKMRELMEELEVSLGPDTGDLDLRVGLHSGPVVGGVLRGERGRFQLFGDTMNTASRMESTSSPSRIQVSQKTKDILQLHGKDHWLTERIDEVVAKGKGRMKTYWLAWHEGKREPRSHNDVNAGAVASVASPQVDAVGNKAARLVKWNVELLAGLLCKIQGHRLTSAKPAFDVQAPRQDQGSILEEVQDIIALPVFSSKTNSPVEVDRLDDTCMVELHSFVSSVARLYNDNPFHNFEHASHVTISVMKLIGRIVNPRTSGSGEAADLHDHTFGITSDPLTQFACVFNALIHDLDHQGVPNATLVKEESYLAQAYSNKSVAEQNSFSIAWDLLMSDEYATLRRHIYSDEEEMNRFRQLLVNSIVATDIADKELAALRRERWSLAFDDHKICEDDGHHHTTNLQISRKATIVLEHLIQASDVSHTMQHWHIFIKWNERLFREMFQAFKAGRLDVDPSVSWYENEIGFFDFYIIPLAKKLGTCGVFGVSSDECLDYAQKNRARWEIEGEALVEQYLLRCSEKDTSSMQSFRVPKI